MSYEEDRLALVDNEAQRHDEVDQQRRPMSSFDIESSVTSRQHHRRVVRPSRGLQIAKPTPFDPTTDPFAFVCDTLRRPKFGHQYVLFPERNGKRGDRGVGPSVGPHWAGVVYTISIIGVITLFLAKVLIGPDVAPWCQPVIVICSAVTVVLLLATAVADPGIGERLHVDITKYPCGQNGFICTYGISTYGSFALTLTLLSRRAIASDRNATTRFLSPL